MGYTGNVLILNNSFSIHTPYSDNYCQCSKRKLFLYVAKSYLSKVLALLVHVFFYSSKILKQPYSSINLQLRVTRSERTSIILQSRLMNKRNIYVELTVMMPTKNVCAS